VPQASQAWKVGELKRLAMSGLEVAAFRVEALRRLRSMLTIDAAFFAAVDPETLLFTSVSSEDPLVEAASLFLENEYGRNDVNKFTALAFAADPVSSLDMATRGDRTESARFRELMAPLGLGDELRVALMSRRRCWGVLCLHRSAAAAGFDANEIALVRQIAPVLAEGIRRGISIAGVMRDAQAPPRGAGVVVIDTDLSVLSINAPAQHWLNDIEGQWPSNFDVPIPVIAAAARVIAPDMDGPVESALVRLPSKHGGWISVEASLLRGQGQEQVVVLLQPATSREVSSMVLAAHGLTPAQHRVAALVLQGRSTSEIVLTLQISTNTLQEHLRAVFDRFGVGNRRELVAALMAQRR
jgi:DNA-binding CsgD family transcriptional regulator